MVGEINRHVPHQTGPSGYAKKRGKPKIKAASRTPRPLSPADEFAAQARAIGRRHKAIAEELGVSVGALQRILGKQKVKNKIKALRERNEADVIALLKEGEMLAAEFLNNLLVDDEADAALKLKAAESLLDRMGIRGRPVERKMEQSVQFTGDVDSAVARALADPGVRSWLEAGGLGSLKQLPASVAEEVIVGSVPSPESSETPGV